MKRILALTFLALMIPAVVSAGVPVDPHMSNLGVAAWSSDDAPVALETPDGPANLNDIAADVWLEPMIPGEDADLGGLSFGPSGQAVTGSDSYEGDYPEGLDLGNGATGIALNPRGHGGYDGPGRRMPTGSDQPTNPVNPVPEPATVMLLAGGAAAAIWTSRKRPEVASKSDAR